MKNLDMIGGTQIKTTIAELRVNFINRAAPLVDQYIDAALGEGNLKSTNSGAREAVWNLLRDLIVTNSEVAKIDISNATAIKTAIEEGILTIKQGKELLAMHKTLKEADLIGKAGGGLGNVIPVINIGVRDDDSEEEARERSKQRSSSRTGSSGLDSQKVQADGKTETKSGAS